MWQQQRQNEELLSTGGVEGSKLEETYRRRWGWCVKIKGGEEEKT